jgi:hypothetical protein
VILRTVGFFRELRHGMPDGPSLHDAVGTLPADLHDRVWRYLESGAVLVASSGIVDDVLDPDRQAVATPDMMTDGTWLWPRDLAYYVANHQVGLPAEFLATMESNGWRAPELSQETLMARAVRADHVRRRLTLHRPPRPST